MMIDAVELTNGTDAMEGDTHSDEELGGGEIDAGHHLGGGMFNLKTGVQFEEVEDIVRVAVKV